MKIVFDTNVIIASLISHGTCYELFDYCITSHHVIIISKWILNEVIKNLIKKFKYSEIRVKEVVNLLNNSCLIIKNFKLPKNICRDKDDDNILAAGLFSKADCIITGDKDLLVIKNFKNIKIIHPGKFWEFEKNMKHGT